MTIQKDFYDLPKLIILPKITQTQRQILNTSRHLTYEEHLKGWDHF